MICYKDRTWCCSPNCKNECGRQMSDAEKQKAKESGLAIMWANFCDEDRQDINHVMYDVMGFPLLGEEKEK